MSESNHRSTGLALGTDSVAMAVVQHIPGNTPELIAFERIKCRYLRDGLIVNLEALIDAIQQCKKNMQSLVKVNSSHVNVNLCGVRLRKEHGTTSITLKKSQEIRKKHLKQIHRVRLVQDDPDWVLVHNLPESYTVDSQSGFMSPIGMKGSTLSADVQQIFAPRGNIENILYSMSKCKLTVDNIVADPLASVEALLTEDEREMGICVLDIGGSVIQMASIFGQKIRIPPPVYVGGDLVTSDIAIGLNTTIKDAERIKIEHGCAIADMAFDDRKIHIPPLGGGQAENPTSQHRLAEIIQSRMEEIYELVTDTFSQLELPEHFTNGVVITGGTSLMKGSVELAEKYLGMPVIEGHLRDLSGLTDICPVPLVSTAAGLALYGIRHRGEQRWEMPGHSTFKQLTQSIFSWFGGDK